MTNEEMAQAYLEQALEILIEAESFYRRGVWNLVMRRAQEAVEMALKAALRGMGVEVPRTHDVGLWLREYREKFPPGFAQDIDRLAAISRRLRREREVSFYGDEEVGAPPQAIYTQTDAQEALEEAEWVVGRCRDLWGSK
ncbi:MAG: HEPN domain-containing protein [Anaerolineae bacterium]|nr:HEPN domain-containing protein [Anaerolineae bacterium]